MESAWSDPQTIAPDLLEDEKEWRDGYQKYCTKPNKWNDNGGRYPEECFSYE